MPRKRASYPAGLSFSQEVISAYLLALQAKRFVILTGISGTGKTQLALATARLLGTGTRSRPVTEVPEGSFEFTVQNLARVEQYFSDFLSALESGEPIELHNDDDVETGEKSDDVPVPRRMRIPSNLYFTGTVNVDETTYMFSSKVLDRAFVLELNLVDLEGFSATGVGGQQRNPSGLRLVGLPIPLHTERRPTAEDWERLGTLLEWALRRVVVDLHRLLERQNRHFGYRVANEIARFVVLALDQCTDAEDSGNVLWDALDLAVLFKVLPKLHGTQQELEDLLATLFVFATTTDYEAAIDPEQPYQGWLLERDSLKPAPDSGNEPAYLPRAAAKLYRMAEQLRRRGFTSFIE